VTAHVLPYHDDGFAQSVTLRDGCVVVVRPIGPDDKDRLVAGLASLSEESAYRRFLAPHGTFTHDELVYLTEVDHHDHEALVAIGPDGHGAGIARYVRLADDPLEAEVAVTVIDDMQGRGLGTELLTLLAARARAEGVRRFVSLVLADNVEMRATLDALGPTRAVGAGAGTIELVTEIPEAGLAEGLRILLRKVAAKLVMVPAGHLGHDR